MKQLFVIMLILIHLKKDIQRVLSVQVGYLEFKEITSIRAQQDSSFELKHGFTALYNCVFSWILFIDYRIEMKKDEIVPLKPHSQLIIWLFINESMLSKPI